jgi:glycosyltransferase involved in cell wall biosynthesis
VSSDVGGVPNMIDDKKNGFIFSLAQPNQLYDILLSLYDNGYLIKKISSSAQKMAHEKYHHHLVAQKTLLFYKRCIIK